MFNVFDINLTIKLNLLFRKLNFVLPIMYLFQLFGYVSSILDGSYGTRDDVNGYLEQMNGTLGTMANTVLETTTNLIQKIKEKIYKLQNKDKITIDLKTKTFENITPKVLKKSIHELLKNVDANKVNMTAGELDKQIEKQISNNEQKPDKKEEESKEKSVL